MAQHSAIVRHYERKCIRPTHIGSGPRPVEFEQRRAMSGQRCRRLTGAICWPPPKLLLRDNVVML